MSKLQLRSHIKPVLILDLPRLKDLNLPPKSRPLSCFTAYIIISSSVSTCFIKSMVSQKLFSLFLDASTPVIPSAKRHWTGSEAGGRKSPVKAARVAAERQRRESPHREPGGSERLETAASACPHLDQTKQEVAKTDDGRQSRFFSATVEPQSPSNRAEPDLKALWTNLPKDHMTVSHPHQNSHCGDDAFGLKLVSVSGSVSAEYEAAGYDPDPRAAAAAAGGRGKRFACCVCSKTYATAQNLGVHMRIHTGVRPFGCEHCGKKFLQSAHLKSHLSIHTGKRPHVCPVCSRSFIVKYSLNLHMKKCHVSPS